MLSASTSCHDRNDLYNTRMKQPYFTCPRLHRLVIIAVPLMFSRSAAAFPLISMAPRGSESSLEGRDHSTNVPAQVWVPILVITLFLALAAIWTCTKKRWWRPSMFSWGTAASAAEPTQETRELTAEQLAGSINANAAPTTTRPRRNRRPRRTPSQISTTSLPAYNKEPGEQELVIFRGPEDLEDAGMPTAVVMAPVSEEGEYSTHSRDNSEAYRLMPESPNDMPLLEEGNSSADRSIQSLQPEDNLPRQSVETLNSSEEASSLMRVNRDAPAYSNDPRGEAPAYFEAVDLTEDLPETPTQPPSATPPSPPERAPPRRSGFRQLLSALPNRLSMSHGASHGHSSHARTDSSFSLVPSNNSHGRERSRSRASHHSSPSGSGSLLSLGPFRTISRQSNSVNLNSPSLISLNSISAPLTHTVVRTEFTYPKSGPTPEQLKLISSRESFARFGMPYGADAIAYAASASVPPPDFDISDPEISPVPGSSQAGLSRLRAMSNAEDLAEAQVPHRAAASSLENDIQPAHSSSPQTHESPSHHLPQTGQAPTSDPETSLLPTTLPGTGTPPADSHPADLVTAAFPSSHPQESKASLVQSNASSELGLGVPPPSSYKIHSIYSRSESRASSVQTFATAAESMHIGQIDTDSGIAHSDISEPTTPKIAVQSTLPSVDTTVARTGVTSTEAIHAS